MSWLEEINLQQFFLFSLVLTRTSGLVMLAPIYGSGQVPVRIRVFLAIALALLITPTQIDTPVEFPSNIIDYATYAAGELLVGLALGVGLLILFAGIQLAGQLISMVSGIALANVINPEFGAPMPVFSQFLYLVMLAVFTTIGGHRLVMEGLLDTFVSVPPGGVTHLAGIPNTINLLMGESYVLAVRTAAPVLTAVLMSILVTGLISRTMPQLNILAVGFGLNSMISMSTIFASLGGIAWLFQAEFERYLEHLIEAVNNLGNVLVPL